MLTPQKVNVDKPSTGVIHIGPYIQKTVVGCEIGKGVLSEFPLMLTGFEDLKKLRGLIETLWQTDGQYYFDY